MDEYPGRFRRAARKVGEAMDKIAASDPAQAGEDGPVRLYPVDVSHVAWAYHDLDRPQPEALVILPAPGRSVMSAGISAETLRKVPMGEIIAESVRLASEAMDEEEATRALHRLPPSVKSRRRDDLYYAMVAEAYWSVTARGDTRPVVTLAMLTGASIDTMRTHVREARSRGLLTAEPGKAGGELTDKARALLRPVWDAEEDHSWQTESE